MNDRVFDDVCLSRITVVSGVRPAGRSTDYLANGRFNHGILYIRYGEACFWDADGRDTRVADGEVAFLPKGYRYKMQYTAPTTAFTLINFDALEQGNGLGLLPDGIEILTKDDASDRIQSIMASLELCGTSQSPAALFRRKELVYRLLRVLYEADPAAHVKHRRYPQISAGVLMLEQTFLENVPVTAFAAASNLSISSFRSLFGKQYGMSPIQYRNRLRIDKARAILLEGSCTVAEAAYACGFDNLGYFCRYYKKTTGETPLQTKTRGSAVRDL